ncbi:MAG: YraN family protein [Angelakisella sp.]
MAEQGYKKQTGDRGEGAAADYLVKNGYRILVRNWHCKGGELDIVATKGDVIAFVEVKTRQPDALVSPLAAVNYQKQRRVIRSAMAYLSCHSFDLQPRFDVAAVTVEDSNYTVEYWEAAFDASANW